MTQLTLPDNHRTFTLRIAKMFFHDGMNTKQISNALSLPESEVWNRMDLAREFWRQQEVVEFDKARGFDRA